MKYPLLITRVFLTIIMILVVGLFPHHHHHGELCWVFEKDAIHHHEGENHNQDCPSDPCDDSTCYLQSFKSFLQAERPHNDHHLDFIAIVPEFFRINPLFYILSFSKITNSGHLVLSSHHEGESRRGPPLC